MKSRGILHLLLLRSRTFDLNDQNVFQGIISMIIVKIMIIIIIIIKFIIIDIIMSRSTPREPQSDSLAGEEVMENFPVGK